MKKFLLLTLLLTCYLMSTAQNAQLQIIHNSPTPTVDIWVNGDKFIENVAFRTATEFIEVPAGVDLVVGVAPSPSDDAGDIIARATINLNEDEAYVAMARGIVGDMTTPFTIDLIDNARTQATEQANFDLLIAHGSTDAPMVDVLARNVGTLANDLSYGQTTEYLEVQATNYIVDIVDPANNELIVASYEAQLVGAPGVAGVVFASGFLNPGMDDPAFGLFAALPDGSVLELPAVTNEARLQVIHNSPSPTVDIWVNGTKALDSVAFRTATEFLTLPAGVNLEIGVAPYPSDDVNDIIATFGFVLNPQQNFIAMATGIVGDMDNPFFILGYTPAQLQAGDPANVDLAVYHGATDAPAVNVTARGVGELVSGLEYGEFNPYLSVPAANYILDISPSAAPNNIVASYEAPLSGLAGGAAVVFASGFLDPGMDEPAFGLFAALPDGTVLELPATTAEAQLQIIHNSPSPTVDIWVNGNKVLDTLKFREATSFLTLPAGQDLEIGVAPSPSNDVNDIIATFDVVLAPDQNYVAIATGIVGDMNTPFDLDIITPAQTASMDTGNVDFSVYHGSTDAPSVDVMARGVGMLVDSLEYRDFTSYLSVPAADYTLDIRPTNAPRPAPIVASYLAPLSGLGGGAAVVFASGFLNPGMGDPGFGLFAALPDGTVLELPTAAAEAQLQIIHNSPSPTVDIWVNGTKVLDTLKFRTATEFLTLPAGQELVIGVAPSPSSDPSEIIATQTTILNPDVAYIAMARGVVGNGNTPFNIDIVSPARTSAQMAGNVEFSVFHGSPDAPEVNIDARGVGQLFGNLEYTDATTYISVPADDYIIDVRPSANPQAIAASYEAPLSGLADAAGVVFASGYVAPPTNDDPAFGLFFALPDGQVIELPAAEAEARLQIIHNSPSPTVDIWVNGTKVLDTVDYRTATSFLPLPAGTNLNIGVAPSPSTSAADIIYDVDVTLQPDESYVAIATGIVGNMDTPFEIVLIDGIRERANDPDNVDFVIFHGSTDAPTVDAIARGVATLADDISYGEFTDYLEVPAANYILDVTDPVDNDIIVASFAAPLETGAGFSAVVFASGFIAGDMDDPEFGLFVALPNGIVIPLPQLPNLARLQVVHNSPSPTVDLYVNDVLLQDSFAYRTATPFIDVPAGLPLEVGVAVYPSAGPQDIIATFPVTFEPSETYVVVASGIVGNMDTPFDLNIIEGAQESSVNATDFTLGVLHGSTDAPAVDVIARGVGALVEDIEYFESRPYFSVPAIDYTLDIAAAGTTPPLFTYRAPLSGLAGGAGLVFASGFVTPPTVDDPGFGLFVALPNGEVIALPIITSTFEPTSFDTKVFPTLTAGGPISITWSGAEGQEFDIMVVDMNGRMVKHEQVSSNRGFEYNLETQGLRAGTYKILLTNDNQFETKSFVVQ